MVETEIKDVIHVQNIANSEFKLAHTDTHPFNIPMVEARFNAKYIGEFCLPSSSNTPSLLFYTKEKHPEGSNYVALTASGLQVIASNGISAAERTWAGLANLKTKYILYSSFRHDYQSLDGLFIDGGLDYSRHSPEGLLVEFKIIDGEIVLLQNENQPKLTINH